MLSAIMLIVIMLIVIMLNVIILKVILLNAIMLNVIMLNVIIPSLIMLNAIMSSVVEPKQNNVSMVHNLDTVMAIVNTTIIRSSSRSNACRPKYFRPNDVAPKKIS